ncbi:MAG: hypothetical protein DCC75_11785 [Proteobacteria bacterium]|nr:MAG: hypothetical protein DCC75_11785 [Pseudomonadota bacterium]
MRLIDFCEEQGIGLVLFPENGRWAAVVTATPVCPTQGIHARPIVANHGDTPDKALNALASCLRGQKVRVGVPGATKWVELPADFEECEFSTAEVG